MLLDIIFHFYFTIVYHAITLLMVTSACIIRGVLQNVNNSIANRLRAITTCFRGEKVHLIDGCNTSNGKTRLTDDQNEEA